MPPKSEKLKREEEAGTSGSATAIAMPDSEPVLSGPIQIREVECLNEFVAILQFEIESSIDLGSGDSKYKNEGIVVGTGPGVSDNAGGRLESQVKIGDVVMFGGKNVVAQIASDSPPYKGRKIVIVSERNLICRLHKKVDWVPYDDAV